MVRPPFPLREAHAHIAALGESLTIPSLASCTSLRACLETIAAVRAAAGTSGGEPPFKPFVRLTAARVAAWPEARWPTLAELDAACPGVPCVVMSFDHHAACGNSAALKAANLAPGQRVGANGVVETGPDGCATGLLIEDAAYAAWGGAPEPTTQERVRHVTAALDHLWSLGYTEVDDLHSQAWLGPALAELDRAGQLKLRVGLYPPFAQIDAAAESRHTWETPRVRLAGAKLFADGTLNSRTAFMLHRYAQPLLNAPRGNCMLAPAFLDQAFAHMGGLGLPLAIHAIGDGAVRTVLDSLERTRGGAAGATDQPGLTPGGRHRIEHCELIDARDVPRFARLGVVASVQPCHLLADIEALNHYLPHRLDRVLPLRELIESGCKPGPEGLLWFGSDVPIVPADPDDTVQAAVYRRRAGMDEEQAIALKQAIREEEVWEGLRAGPGKY